MKFLRFWLVALLAVLLPIRGLMAAAMPCASSTSTAAMEHQLRAGPPGQDHATKHEHSAHAAKHTAQQHEDDTATAGHNHPTQKCNACSASCSTPPLPSASAEMIQPAGLADTSFPHLSAPTTTFQSEGQERPPRTI